MRAKTFDDHNINDGTNFTSRFPINSGVWGLAQRRVGLVRRAGRGPLVSGIQKPGRVIPLNIQAVGSDLVALRDQLMGWLDVDEPKLLVVTDTDGVSNERYVYAMPTQIVPSSEMPMAIWTVIFQVHGDLKWRAKTEDTDSWSITASGDTKVVTNDGDADAFPVLTLRPTSGNASGYAYKRWVPLRWRAPNGAAMYPLDITDGGWDTAALVTAGKVQADGDDCRVKVDGVEMDRWFGTGTAAFNQTGTKIWVNLDFQADIDLTLATAIASTGTVDSIEVNESIEDMPSEGILLIGSEAFTYSSKDNASKTFSNVQRGQRDTSLAAHSVDDNIYWIQRDVFIEYGNASASAPTVDDDYKPIFELDTSTNSSWVYEEFGNYGGTRTGSWTYVINSPSSTLIYTGNRGLNADPWEEMGIQGKANSENGADAYWRFYNPCGIDRADFFSGERYEDPQEGGRYFYMAILTAYGGDAVEEEDYINDTDAVVTWESWGNVFVLSNVHYYIKLWGIVQRPFSAAYIETSEVTVTLHSATCPTVSVLGNENGSYQFLPVILNETTGESISLDTSVDVNEQLEVDTDAKTITYLKDGASKFEALTIVGDPRQEWLPLQPGNNTLKWTDAGTGNVTVGIEFRKRWR